MEMRRFLGHPVLSCVKRNWSGQWLSPVYSDTTQLNSTSSCRHVHSVNDCHRSVLNVVDPVESVCRPRRHIWLAVWLNEAKYIIDVYYWVAAHVGEINFIYYCKYSLLICTNALHIAGTLQHRSMTYRIKGPAECWPAVTGILHLKVYSSQKMN